MARKPSSTPTDAELRLLRLLWSDGPLAAADVAERLRDPKLAKNTVLTTLKVLEEKGFVTHATEGRTFIYSAAVDPQSVRRKAISNVVSRFFQDSPKDLILHLLDEEYVEPAQAARIRALLQMDEER
jgi:predicted transcriptional regulator